MISAKFKKGSYYIGALKYILSYESLCEIKFGFGKVNSAYEYANFNVGVHDDGLEDSDKFRYCIDDETLGIISSDIIDKELLSERILTLRNSVLANKFTSFFLARVVEFKNDFIVSFDEKSITIADLNIKFR
ncbi:Uncharacterised protein [Campylobacter hyointestinalis]|uniref:hypothetical protein n=1 Tax=Campylobacter hyointestinalis TaxID=198 RepID=UPI000726E427|nr:hypothetical protein [Campylobacter hyointestinalis]PPB56595.1 hypothetical protein CDQ67_00110 [Campylobacter hyointestinalis subsp. hyointestinalis]CUU70757.1 Uncharacterised protein [Campylobacter hyointestinalis]